MKTFLLKSLNVILTLIMIVSALYAVFNLVMTFLPSDISRLVYNWLRISQEYIATFSVTVTINAAILIATKLLQTISNTKLLSKLADAQKVINQGVSANDAVVERANSIVNNMNVIQDLTNAIVAVQKVTAKRNINANDIVVSSEEKDEYKKAIEAIEAAQSKLTELKNISTVFEKTEIREVIVERTKDEFSGRV